MSKFSQDLQACYIFLILEHLRGAYLECTACSDGYKKEQHQVHGFLQLYRRKKKVLQKYLLCKLFILMPRVKTISIKWTNPATSFLGVKVSWERVLNSYLHFTQSFKSSSWTMFCHHILWLSIGQFLITLSYALTEILLLGKFLVGPFIRY